LSAARPQQYRPLFRNNQRRSATTYHCFAPPAGEPCDSEKPKHSAAATHSVLSDAQKLSQR
jgi:hypothetical protein